MTNTDDVFKVFIKSNKDIKRKKYEIYYCKLSLNNNAKDYYKKFFVLQSVLYMILYLNNNELEKLKESYKTYNSGQCGHLI